MNAVKWISTPHHPLITTVNKMDPMGAHSALSPLCKTRDTHSTNSFGWYRLHTQHFSDSGIFSSSSLCELSPSMYTYDVPDFGDACAVLDLFNFF